MERVASVIQLSRQHHSITPGRRRFGVNALRPRRPRRSAIPSARQPRPRAARPRTDIVSDRVCRKSWPMPGTLRRIRSTATIRRNHLVGRSVPEISGTLSPAPAATKPHCVPSRIMADHCADPPYGRAPTARCQEPPPMAPNTSRQTHPIRGQILQEAICARGRRYRSA